MIGEYQTLNTIGKGNFSVVKLAIHHRLGIQVAIKVINKTLFDESFLLKIRREIEAMKKLSHQYVIKLFEILETDCKIYLIMEYASGGEIFEQLRIRERYSESDAREIFWQVICAVNYCHKQGVVHRDLKAENLLINHKNQVKLADFGFCNFFDCCAPLGKIMNTHCGSPQYAGPELFRGEHYDGTKADIWSLGVILYILVCGRFPFSGDSVPAIRSKVYQGHLNFQFYVSDDFRHLVRGILRDSPTERFSLIDIVDSEWMKCSTHYHKHLQIFNQFPGHFSIGGQYLTNHIVDILVKRYGYNEKEIIHSINGNAFDSNFAAYHILLDHFLEKADQLNANVTSSIQMQSGTTASHNHSTTRRLSSSVPETILINKMDPVNDDILMETNWRDRSLSNEDSVEDQVNNNWDIPVSSALEECSWTEQQTPFFLDAAVEDSQEEDAFDPQVHRLMFKSRAEMFNSGVSSRVYKRRHTFLPTSDHRKPCLDNQSGSSHTKDFCNTTQTSHTSRFPVDRRASMGSQVPNAFNLNLFHLDCFPHPTEYLPHLVAGSSEMQEIDSQKIEPVTNNMPHDKSEPANNNHNKETMISLATDLPNQISDTNADLCALPLLQRPRIYQKRASLPAQMILPQLPEIPPCDGHSPSLSLSYQPTKRSLVRLPATIPLNLGSLDVIQSELQTLSMQHNLPRSKHNISTLSDLSEGYHSEICRDLDGSMANYDQSNSPAVSCDSALTPWQSSNSVAAPLIMRNSCQQSRKQDQFSLSPPNSNANVNRYNLPSHPYHHGRRRSSPSVSPFYSQITPSSNAQFSSVHQDRMAPLWPPQSSTAQSNQELNDDLIAIQRVNEKVRKEYLQNGGGGALHGATSSCQPSTVRRGSFQTTSTWFMPLLERERRPSAGELVLLRSSDSTDSKAMTKN